MPRTVFVTGASGYLGQRVLRSLSERPGLASIALDRRELAPTPGVRAVRGDILAPSTYRAALEGADCVLHLAAVTGKARRSDYLRVNAEGTRTLLREAEAAGVGSFVHVSSIAVAFRDRYMYHYAESKILSERYVREGNVPHAIVRPTIIAGPGAPVVKGLESLALAPVMPVFGDGRAPVQPVHVLDLARILTELAGRDDLSGETIEVGGPERLTIEEFLAKIRTLRGGEPGRVLHLPLGPIRRVLALLEPGFLEMMPLTAGQLASFGNDGTAAPHPLAPVRSMRGLREMLAEGDEDDPLDRDALRREADVFARLLTKEPPTDYVADKYVAFHEKRGDEIEAGADRVDEILLALARKGPLPARFADAYAGRFRRSSPLRRKLVAMVSLLEATPPGFTLVDTPDHGGPAIAWMRLFARMFGEGLTLFAAALFLLPLDLLLGRRGGAEDPS